jgi:DNA-binding GntR family transcriptional regulator
VGDQHMATFRIPQRSTSSESKLARACAPAAARVCSAIVPPSPSRPAARTAPKRRTAAPRAGADEPQDNVSRAYHDLRSVIVWGQLPPGTRISERVIGERLGLSRTPVRSALHRLEQEGFVASAGTGRERRLIVAPLTRDDGEEVYRIVGHLEGLAARMAAALPAARRKAIATRLRALNRELARESRKREDAARVFDLDLEFHRTYVEGVVGPRLLTLHRAIKPQSERYSRLYVTVLLDELSASVKEHEAIASSIAKGDPDGAQRAAETNWHNAARRLARIIAQHGERGSWTSWEHGVIHLVPSAGRKVRF